MTDVQSLIEDFTNQLSAALERQAMERARLAVESAFGVRGPGRAAKVSAIAIRKKPRKTLPRQLCPVPGCRSPAAPVYGMVCAQHKNVPKTKIKKYREARRAKKLGIMPAKTARTKKPGIKAKAPKRKARKVAELKPVAAAKPPVAAAA